jgi:small subunit ribosomal protein S2
MIDLKLLVKNGVHFGHQTSRWSPKMEPYIWGQKNDIHLIDVSKTAMQLEKAAQFLKSVAEKGAPILWVGTKKAAREGVSHTAQELSMPYCVNRWVGGTLTNYRQVKKSVANLLHYEDVLDKSEKFPYNKKELGVFQKKAEKLESSVGGIRKLTWPVGALIVVDIKREHVAIKEALAEGVPVIALVDTNSDPTGIDYVIPANDDAPRSINVVLNYLKDAIQSGKDKAEERKKQEQEAQELEKSQSAKKETKKSAPAKAEKQTKAPSKKAEKSSDKASEKPSGKVTEKSSHKAPKEDKKDEQGQKDQKADQKKSVQAKK